MTEGRRVLPRWLTLWYNETKEGLPCLTIENKTTAVQWLCLCSSFPVINATIPLSRRYALKHVCIPVLDIIAKEAVMALDVFFTTDSLHQCLEHIAETLKTLQIISTVVLICSWTSCLLHLHEFTRQLFNASHTLSKCKGQTGAAQEHYMLIFHLNIQTQEWLPQTLLFSICAPVASLPGWIDTWHSATVEGSPIIAQVFTLYQISLQPRLFDSLGIFLGLLICLCVYRTPHKFLIILPMFVPASPSSRWGNLDKLGQWMRMAKNA